MRKNPGPLSGVKVVEFAHVMAGPVCGKRGHLPGGRGG